MLRSSGKGWGAICGRMEARTPRDSSLDADGEARQNCSFQRNEGGTSVLLFKSGKKSEKLP